MYKSKTQFLLHINFVLPLSQALTSRQHDRVFQDILKFISKSSKQLEKLSQLSAPSQASLSRPDSKLPPRLEVPTVALVAGVNMPDHDVLFDQLRTCIRMDGISPHVVLLKSKDCNSGKSDSCIMYYVAIMKCMSSCWLGIRSWR